MSGSFSRSFLKIERSRVLRPAQVPNTFREFPVSTALPQRFCKNCQTSVLFRLGAINFHLRLHGRHSAYSLPEVNVQVHATVPGSALLIQPVALAVSCDDLARLPSKARGMMSPRPN
jgi:hypothetical protein